MLSLLSGTRCVSHNIARSFTISTPLTAGHNKWSKVKNFKIPNDIKKNKAFQPIIKEITTIVTATKNPDIESNSRLRAVCENAPAAGYLKAKLLSAIENASKVRIKEDTYKISKNDLAFVVKTYTTMYEDTAIVNRNIKKLCEKEGLRRASFSFSDMKPDVTFETKVMACIKSTDENPISEDQAYEYGLEAEAEDIEFDEEKKEWVFVKSGTELELQKTRTMLEKHVPVDSCDLIFVPYIPLDLTSESYKAAEKLFSQFISIENVTDVIKNYNDIDS